MLGPLGEVFVTANTIRQVRDRLDVMGARRGDEGHGVVADDRAVLGVVVERACESWSACSWLKFFEAPSVHFTSFGLESTDAAGAGRRSLSRDGGP